MRQRYNLYKVNKGPSMRPLSYNMKLKYYYRIFLLFFLVATPIVLLILPADFFDNGTTICLSKLFTSKECYACGITKGIMHLIHLDFENAFAYNMLSFIVFPLLSLIWVQWFLKEYKIFKLIKLKLSVKV